ncbi:TPA: hypothetical protein O4G40_003229 [Vibrio alginolyticus]|nr:hypothetical protein [Vibrio alginolyticus]
MDKFGMLQELGAGDFKHLNGSLEVHLKGTEQVLINWGSSELLQIAGLFHAAYGTADFDENMVSLSQRQEIARIIGNDEEALVYLYCSCDRKYVFPQFGKVLEIQFKDRFTGSTFKLKYGAELFELFQGMDSYLSTEARKAYKSALSNFA